MLLFKLLSHFWYAKMERYGYVKIYDTLTIDPFFFQVWIITFLWLSLEDNDELSAGGAHMPVFSQVPWGVIFHFKSSFNSSN